MKAHTTGLKQSLIALAVLSLVGGAALADEPKQPASPAPAGTAPPVSPPDSDAAKAEQGHADEPLMRYADQNLHGGSSIGRTGRRGSDANPHSNLIR